MLRIIFQEILDNENKKVSDIKYAGGVFSNVFIIGSKVIKIGERNTFKIENNKRFLKPLLRMIIKINNKEICIEITERVSYDVTEEDVYLIYRKLRNKNIS